MVRPVSSEADRSRFTALFVEYENALPEELRIPDLPGEVERIEETFVPPNCAFVALVDDEPAGCVALAHLDADTAVVKRLYVKPAFRNRGLARALMQGIIAYSRGAGYARLALDTDRERLKAAYDLYASLGFHECAPYDAVHYSCPTFMELRLDRRQ